MARTYAPFTILVSSFGHDTRYQCQQMTDNSSKTYNSHKNSHELELAVRENDKETEGGKQE